MKAHGHCRFALVRGALYRSSHHLGEQAGGSAIGAGKSPVPGRMRRADLFLKGLLSVCALFRALNREHPGRINRCQGLRKTCGQKKSPGGRTRREVQHAFSRLSEEIEDQ